MNPCKDCGEKTNWVVSACNPGKFCSKEIYLCKSCFDKRLEKK